MLKQLLKGGRSDEKPPVQTEAPEDLLFAAMDKAAARFAQILDDPKDKEGNSIYSLEEQIKAFNLGRDWLIRRAKLRPREQDDGSPGVEEIRRLIAEEAAKGGYVRAEPKKKGRPPKAVSDARKAARTPADRRADDNDDSGLQAMLKGKTQ